MTLTVKDLIKMLSREDPAAEIVVESCCCGGCVLTPTKVEPWRTYDGSAEAKGILMLCTQDDE